MQNNEILEAAIWRYAVKTFDITKKVSDMDFDTLVNVARYSPSSFGLEPWKMIVVQNAKLRNRIAEYASGAQRQLATASHFVIFAVTADLEPESEYIKHISFDVKKNSESSYAETVAKIDAFQKNKHDLTDRRKRVDWAGKQAYMALANMIFAAAIMRIDSCPIEGFTPNGVENVLSEEGIIDSAKENVAVMGAFGYRLSGPEHAKVRRPFKEVVDFI